MQEPQAAQTPAATETVTLASGLKYQVVKPANESTLVAEIGKAVTIDYTALLEEDGHDGKKFDSSIDRGQPFTFTLGSKQVIAGMEEGIENMKVGEIRRLVIPPQLAYGENGAGGVIPANATLIFDVELKAVA